MTPLIPVRGSSSVRAFAYELATQTLTVQYASSTYTYFAVPADVARAVADAADDPEVSFGSWLTSNVKGKFDYARQAEEPSVGEIDLGEPWSFPSRSGLG